MNIQQAKAIPLADLLNQLGHAPARQSGSDIWYCSPFRNEQTPSFKTNSDNKWYDFGTGEHGDGIDLVQRLLNQSSVAEALVEIARLMGQPRPEPKPAESRREKPESSTTVITSEGPLISRSLRGYLRSRGISDHVARLHLKEVRYRRGDRNFFAIGFANDLGNYEIRTQNFKGSLGRKTITTVAGGSTEVSVFEGFTDYLTAITRGLLKDKETAIVMNSTAMKNQVVAKLSELRADRVLLWLDNDETGRRLAGELAEALPDVDFQDQSNLYADFDDLNAYHMAMLSRQK